MCTSPGFGGLEMNALKIAQWLEQHGWQVRLLVNADSPMSREADSFCKDVVTVQSIDSKKSKSSRSVLNKWMKQNKVSILFTPFNKDIKSLAAYKRIHNRKVKLVYQQHMKVGVKKKDIIHRLRYNALDLWISPLPYLKDETMRLTSVPERKIQVIHLGLEADQFLNQQHDKKYAREILYVPDDVKLLGVLGRIDPKKGQDFAIRCIAHLRDHYQKEYHLLIMGNITQNEGDAYINTLHDLVKQHKLEKQVHFQGYQKDVTLFYHAIDVFVMPSHGETYGMVTLEAMLMQKPIIGVDTDGTTELLQYGRFGWLHELEDVEGFCKQLFNIESLPGIDDTLKAAKQEVLQHFSMQQMMEETDRALTQLL